MCVMCLSALCVTVYRSCVCLLVVCFVFFFKQKTAYEMRISDWSSDVCSSDLRRRAPRDPDQARPALCQCRDRRRHGIGRGPAPVARLSPPRGTSTAETMTDTTLAANLAEPQQRAKTWFEALRDRICTAFEALGDAQTGPLARSDEHPSELPP